MAGIELEDEDLKTSLLGLVVALIEIIKDLVNLQAIKRMEKGNLSDEEIERLGNALMNLERVIEEIKEEYAIKESVRSVRDGLDKSVEDIMDKFLMRDIIEKTKDGIADL